MDLEKHYEPDYHVTCKISNTIFAKNTSQSVWIAFESATFSAGRMVAMVVWVLIGMTCFLIATAFAILFVIYRIRRASLENVRRNGNAVTFVADEGVCSTTLDGRSDTSIPCSFDGGKNGHLLHGQMMATRDMSNVCDPFAKGDAAGIDPGSSVVAPNQGSSISSMKSGQSLCMRDQVVRFLDSQPPHYRRVKISAPYRGKTYSLPRFGQAICRNYVRTTDAAVEQNIGGVSTFASLPRRMANRSPWPGHPCGNFGRVSDDSLPPPPPPPPESPSRNLVGEASDLPPPMPAFEQYSYGFSYNAVSPSSNFGRADGGGMSEASPSSGSPCTKFPVAELPGSLL